MRVAIGEKPDTFVAGLVFLRGALSDPEGKEGLAHIVEHVFFRVAVKPTVKRLPFLANAFTTFQHVVFTVEALPEDRKRALSFLERILSKVPTEQELAKALYTEKSVVISEIRRNANNPVRFLTRFLIPRSIYHGRLSTPVTGTVESVESIDLRDLVEWLERRGDPLVVTYGQPAGEVPKVRKVCDVTERDLRVEHSGKGVYGALVWAADPTPALQTLVWYLGNMAGPIWKKVRETGIYAPRFSYYNYPACRIPLAFETQSPAETEEILDSAFEIVMEAFDRLRDGLVDEEVLRIAKKRAKIRLLHRKPSLERLPLDLTTLDVFGCNYTELREKATQITSEELAAYAERIGNPRVVKLIGAYEQPHKVVEGVAKL